MRRSRHVLCSALLLALLPIVCACSTRDQIVAGEWIGAVRSGMTWHAAQLHLEQTGTNLSGTAVVKGMNIYGAPVEGTISGNRLHVRIVAHKLRESRFEGTLMDGRLASATGEWRGPGLNFVRASQLSEGALDDYVGWYEGETPNRLIVMRGSEGGLRFFNLGKLSGTLLPLSGDDFALNYLDQASTTLTGRARFVRDPSGDVIRLEIGDAPVEHGTALNRMAEPPYAQQSFHFNNGDLALGGTLFTPAGAGPFPAVIFIHGTGYQTADRNYEMSLIAPFLDRGIAVLLYDKRGSGRSSGDWRTASLHDLAADVAAAVDAVRRHPSIREDGIGVYGISEGGWVAPVVAASTRLAFVVSQGGPAVPPLEDEIDDLTAGIRRLDLAPDEHAIAMELAYAWVELYRSADALPRYSKALATARERPWFEPFADRLPTSDDHWEVQWWRKRHDLDPMRYWLAVEAPALVLIGEHDETMRRETNVARYEEINRATALELRIVPGADHGLYVDEGLAPGFPADVADWIVGVVAVASGQPVPTR